MSPKNCEMLASEVYPRLRNAAHSIPKTGCEDDEEITHDSLLMAAKMLESAEAAGKTLTAGNLAFYAIKAARSGRRSHYSGRSDVLSPGCQLDGNARFANLDDEIELEMGEVGSLHDLLAPTGYQGEEADPAEEAARNVDWQAFLDASPPRHRIAIGVLVEGGNMREAGKRCGLKDSAALNLKRRIAADLIEFFGEDVIRRILDGIRPEWESNLQAGRERGHRHEGVFQPLAQPIG